MPTLLLSRTAQPEADRLAVAARAARWSYQWLHRRRPPSHLHGREFAYYGETDVGLRLVAEHGLALIEPTFDLLARLPHRFRLREIRLSPLGEALELTEPAFVKPADCTRKAFDAAVWKSGKHIFCADDLSRETLVLVSEPVCFSMEYRAIIHERQVVTFSPYIRDGRLAKDERGQWPYPPDEAEEMLAFCQQLLADPAIDLPPVFTLYVGIIERHGWTVVEFNPVWCSGLLGCDPVAMLPALRRACQREGRLSAADSRWIIRRPAP